MDVNFNEKILSFELVNDKLKFIMNSEIISFKTFNIDYVNTSEVLSFELKSYDSTMPIYGIVLDFIFETGGIL